MKRSADQPKQRKWLRQKKDMEMR